jgi:hypothetical protein
MLRSKSLTKIEVVGDDAEGEAQEISAYLLGLFPNNVNAAPKQQRLLIVVIGPDHHLSFRGDNIGEEKLRAIRQIRTTLAEALSDAAQVILVLVRDAKLPSQGDLPSTLSKVTRSKPVLACGDRWDDGLADLAERIRGILVPASPLRLAINLVLILGFSAWVGSWLDEATGVGDAIQLTWALPLFSQGMIAVWGIVTQLFPYQWNPARAKRIISAGRLTAVLCLLCAGFCAFALTTPILVFKNTGTTNIEIRLYGHLSAPVSNWSEYKRQKIPPNSTGRFLFPFWNRVELHALKPPAAGASGRCASGVIAGIPIGLFEASNKAKAPLQEGCARATLAIPILSHYVDSVPPEFRYPEDVKFDQVLIEPDPTVWQTMQNQYTAIFLAVGQDLRRTEKALPRIRTEIDMRDATPPGFELAYDGSPFALTTALPPGVPFIRGLAPDTKACIPKVVGRGLRIYGLPRPFFAFPEQLEDPVRKYSLTYQYKRPTVGGKPFYVGPYSTPAPVSGTSWSGRFPIEIKKPETFEYCLKFDATSPEAEN